MCVSSRPTMQHPTVSLVCLSTQTLWTSTMVSCQTSMRRILTRGTCRPLVWREVASETTMETCSHPTWLPKVISDFKVHIWQFISFFIACLLYYRCTLAPILSEGGHLQQLHTAKTYIYKDKVRLLSIIFF